MALTDPIRALPEGVIAAQSELMQDIATQEMAVQRALDALATAFGQFQQCGADAVALNVSKETKAYLLAKRAAFIAAARAIFVSEA